MIENKELKEHTAKEKDMIQMMKATKKMLL